MGTQSRNTTFGIALGEGRSPADILAERKVVTEGVHSAASISELGRRLGVEVPIADGGEPDRERRCVDRTRRSPDSLAQPTGSELADLT